MYKPGADANQRVRNRIENLPASISVAREFNTIIRLLKRPNPRSSDWKNLMEAHQNGATLAIIITASGIKGSNLETFIENLFDEDIPGRLGLVILGQLRILDTMVQNYNIVALSGIRRLIPAMI